jgi:uncharacterized protein (TIGR00255 family)
MALKSMTAYGRGECQWEGGHFVAEIRSVNHRYRDLILRIPKNFQALEDELKGMVAAVIGRGRVEVSLQLQGWGEESACRLELNLPLVKSYFRIFERLAEEFGLEQEVRLESLCQMKDVILAQPDAVDEEKVKTGFQEALKGALDSFEAMRIREGEAIEADFLKRLARLESYVEQIGVRAPEVVEAYRKRLRDNIRRLIEDVTLDENRLAQEVAFFAERSDITEEAVRVRSHLEQFHEYLSMDGPQGRRLDFLIQEINREVNTIGSKASDSLISALVVEMKAELEKLREQVQNVE